MQSEYAEKKIDRFKRRFPGPEGEGHFYFACHAAFPIGFTVDMLYQLWVNFRDIPLGVDPAGISIDRLAVSDLIQSDLCRRTDHDIFEMEVEVRSHLMEELKKKFKQERLEALAAFLYQYVDKQISDPYYHSYKDTQKWVALATLAPHLAGEQLAAYFQGPIEENRNVEIFRMDGLLEALQRQDPSFRNLRQFSKGLKETLFGQDPAVLSEAAKSAFRKVTRIDQSLADQAEGIQIRLPERLKETDIEFGQEITEESRLEVLKRIERVRNGRSEELDLSKLGLEAIPTEVFELTELKTLDLYDNKIKIFPEEIGRLAKLEKLMLTRNNIRKLPEGLTKLTELKVIKLDHNELDKFPEVVFQLPLLEDLSLENNRIEFVPLEVGQMKNLRLLDFRGNNILNLPQDKLKFTRGSLQRLLAGFQRSNTDKQVMILAADPTEREGILKALTPAIDQDLLQVEVMEKASSQDLFRLCYQYRDQLAILHINGGGLSDYFSFHTGTGTGASLKKTSFLQLLGQPSNGRLIFLTGGSDKGSVKDLLDAGFGASVYLGRQAGSLADDRFHNEFYAGLAKGLSIREAFDAARPAEASPQQQSNVGNLARQSALSGDNWDYHLTAREDREWHLGWRLTDRTRTDYSPPFEYIKTGAGLSYPSGQPVNQHLFQQLAGQIARYDPSVQKLLDQEMTSQNTGSDWRSLAGAVIQALPAPVAYPLRGVAQQEEAGPERLENMMALCSYTLGYLLFMALAELREQLRGVSSTVPDPGLRRQIGQFLNLSENDFGAFDPMALYQAVLRALNRLGSDTLIRELKELAVRLEKEAILQEFIGLLNELSQKNIPSGEEESFSVQIEERFLELTALIAFIVQYPMVSVRKVEVISGRFRKPAYRYHLLFLNGEPEQGERILEYEQFSDTHSVLLLPSLDQVTSFLNLSPFFIEDKGKLWVYSRQGEEGPVYEDLEAKGGRLEINEKDHEGWWRDWKVTQHLLVLQVVVFSDVRVTIQHDDDFASGAFYAVC